MDACPTGALDEAFVLDATKCISYFTIEKRGEIPREFHESIGSNIFGCDVCQQVCPFNEVAQETDVFNNDGDSKLLGLDLDDLTRISDAEFRDCTRDSALRRCKADGLRRNARIVRENL
jgi:epoxyqueuosine reductase